MDNLAGTNWGAMKRFRLVLREQGQVREMGGEEMSIAVQIVDNIFMNAIEAGASDIHLQPERDQLKIRFRIDGQLTENGQLPPETAANVIARIKLAAGMHIDEKREAQDGRIDMEYNNRRLSARCSVIPALNGEKVVLRILDPGQMRVELSQLGMPPDVLEKWKQAIQTPYGMIMVTGPTGSGKTSTLYASLNTLDRVHRNIVTVEDPIEYEFSDNVTQVQVTEKMTFPRVMRTFLRQDPDVMMVGEMRDPESLHIGIQAALTGHLVLTTIHTNNSIETIGRMFDMGAEPYLVAAVTVAVMAQRLVRVNCIQCAEPYEPPEDELIALGFEPGAPIQGTFRKGKGCAECRGHGYKGRTGVFELFLGTPEMRQAIARGAEHGELMAAARRQGMRTMLEDGRNKVLNGITTADEVLRAVYSAAIG
ncbi:MAG: type II/IV secretion system protein [Armatimonadetes bacterium]|nr:MAG: type II/IV secretion system protein [Armatimonadota bacterium]